ncbi:hypothetical protein MLD38_029262 [Melastoma candidum]|uniref:Uncharacterized protein n=1 Tax=Melastoma candidum TaxID=119954 RepID=A0ACB9N353_9MYRT|nr:hypothetical protein MLD38_029262 [Melastoma candidum]
MAESELLALIVVFAVFVIAVEADDGICKAMVEPRNYLCEEHVVTTQDGYILSLQRVSARISGGAAVRGIPLLLQHGVMMDGNTWLLLPPDKSLAFLLADKGHDVWIANSRGTRYSRGHVSLNSNDGAYWDWSWDELSANDLPATLRYVHDQAGQKLHYIGHSQGTLMALAALSKGQLVDVLRSAILLSPVAYVGRMTSIARAVAEHHIGETLLKLGVQEFNPSGKVVVKLLRGICEQTGTDCTQLLTSFTGQNCCLNPSIVSVFLDHEPQPTSTKNVVHLSQMFRDGTVAMFDYGDEADNRKRYGQAAPPTYNMANVPRNLPLFLSYGGADALSDPDDVRQLLDQLKDRNRDKLAVVYREDYAHADFVMAENAKEVVYDPLMAFLASH